MVCLTILYGQPADPTAFDRYYRETHVPLALKIPGLQGYTLDHPSNTLPGENSPYYLIACLYFKDMAALQAGLQSPEGQSATADVPNFATGGATGLVDEQEVLVPVVRD